MNKLKKTLPLFFLFLGMSFSAVVAQMNGNTQNGNDILLIPTEGNWPNMPPAAPFCYNLSAPDFEFGFGINLNTAGYLQPDQPPLYVSFTVEFNGLPPYTKHVLIENPALLPAGTFNGHTIYYVYSTYFEDLSAICPASMAEGNYTFELTTLSFGVHVPYPVGNYMGPGQMFTSAVFSPDHFVETGTKYYCCDNPLKSLVKQEGKGDQASSIQQLVGQEDISVESNSGALASLIDNPILVYPNPFHDHLNIQLNLAKEDAVKIELLDSTGRLINVEKTFLPSGRQTHSFEFNNMVDGLYFIRTSIGGNVYIEKILKSS